MTSDTNFQSDSSQGIDWSTKVDFIVFKPLFGCVDIIFRMKDLAKTPNRTSFLEP